jgi:hypothetical protein
MARHPPPASASLVPERSGGTKLARGCTTYALDRGNAPSCLAPERSGGAKQLTPLPLSGESLPIWHLLGASKGARLLPEDTAYILCTVDTGLQ